VTSIDYGPVELTDRLQTRPVDSVADDAGVTRHAVLGGLGSAGGIEAVELTESVPGAFDGLILVVLGIVGSLLLVQSISAWRRGPAEVGDARASSGLWVAGLVAEGLVIGSSFALGAIAGGPSSSVGGSGVWRSRRRSGRSSPRSASGPSSRSSSSCAAWSAGRAASGRRSTS
jgi:hypothetical protein